uniref:Uncharacterized protein n=1 Tax=Cucumis melo TaxID=3656 RepID=A0A9I9EHX9_CUCME
MKNSTADVYERWMAEGDDSDDRLDCSRETAARKFQ